MPRPCTICTHSDRRAIDAALHGGLSLRTIAVRWSVSKTSLLRHRGTHLRTAPGTSPRPPACAGNAGSPSAPPAAADLPTPETGPAAADLTSPRAPCTAAECLEVLTTRRLYRQVSAQIRALEALSEAEWAERNPHPRAEVLETIRCTR